MLLFQLRDPETIFIYAVVIFFAFAYHEFGHAYVADRLGDDTPRRYGRLTLNPFPHVQLAGLVMLFLFGFGGAYTPVTPSNLRGNRRRSHAIVAVAGPAMNLMMAAFCAIPYRLQTQGVFDVPDLLLNFAWWGVQLNLFLMVFNLLPIPPLDGFTILMGILPAEIAYRLEPMRQYGMVILLGIVFILPSLVPNFDFLGMTLFPVMGFFRVLLLGF